MIQHADVGFEPRDDTSVLAGASRKSSSNLIENTQEPSDTTPLEAQPAGPHEPSPTQRDQIGEPSTRKPLIGTINECLPDGSALRGYRNPYLGGQDEFGCNAALRMSKLSQPIVFTDHPPEYFWAQLEEANSEHAIIFVDNIDDRWCDALCARYPDSINERFLLEHVLGFDSSLIDKSFMNSLPQQGAVQKSMATDIERIKHALSDRADLFQTDGCGFHVNYWYEPGGSWNTEPLTLGDCIFQSCESGWVKTNRYISCCQLDKSICKYNTMTSFGYQF